MYYIAANIMKMKKRRTYTPQERWAFFWSACWDNVAWDEWKSQKSVCHSGRQHCRLSFRFHFLSLTNTQKQIQMPIWWWDEQACLPQRIYIGAVWRIVYTIELLAETAMEIFIWPLSLSFNFGTHTCPHPHIVSHSQHLYQTHTSQLNPS